jgi:hypothetical protein
VDPTERDAADVVRIVPQLVRHKNVETTII